jgi:ATP-binding cassette, subfamily B, bacterial PglK
MNSNSLINLKRIWRYSHKSHRIKLIMLLILITFVAFFEVLSLGAIVPFLSVLVSPESILEYPFIYSIYKYFGFLNPVEMIIPITIFFSISVLISGILKIWLFWFQIKFSHEIGIHISDKMFQKIIYQPYKYFMTTNSSEIVSVVRIKSEQVVNETIIPSLFIIASTVIASTIIATMLAVNGLITIALFFVILFSYLLFLLFSARIVKKNGESIAHLQGVVIKNLYESIGGIREVIIGNMYSLFVAQFQDSNKSLRLTMATNQIIAGLPKGIIETVAIITMVVIAYFLANDKNTNSAIPILGLFALGAQRLLPAAQNIYSQWIILMGGAKVTTDSLDVLEMSIVKKYTDGLEKKCNFKKSIVLDKVAFSYSDKGVTIFKDLSLKIKKGEIIGIIGKTGSGKSTLVDILMGLIPVSKGSLLIDNCKYDQTNVSEWQSCISHVPQEVFIFDDTIRKNIAISNEIVDEKLLIEASKKSQLFEDILSLPDGFDTFIGERGARLSGGQKQRLGIARALYDCNEVLILDEATSALDSTTEDRVMKAILKTDNKFTAILISHRITTLKNCDRIIEISNNKIVWEGVYSDLINRNLTKGNRA